MGAPPPSGNTGAQTASVDWLGFSFPDGTGPEEVAERLGPEGWSVMPRGWLGYRQGLVRGNCRILFDGAEGMGVHVEVSGQGCRELEGGGIVQDWQTFLGGLLEAGASVSRLDVAVDDFAGHVRLDRVVEGIESGTVVSRYRTWKLETSGSLGDSGSQGRTVYFGSAQSDTRVRIYDKLREQIGRGVPAESLPESWVRVELQARDAKAESMARLLVERGVSVIGPVLRALLDFKEAGTCAQRERWASTAWWSAFLGSLEKVRLTVAGVVRTAAHVYGWLRKQIAPALAVVWALSGGETAVLSELVEHGRERWRRGSWHLQVLRESAAFG